MKSPFECDHAATVDSLPSRCAGCGVSDEDIAKDFAQRKEERKRGAAEALRVIERLWAGTCCNVRRVVTVTVDTGSDESNASVRQDHEDSCAAWAFINEGD